MKRRTFIRNTLAGSALLAAFPYEALALEEKLFVHDRVKLGNTGIEMSRMAMGTGTHGFGGASNQTRQMGIKGVSDMVAEGFVAGQEDKARFEILTTVNHVSMYDVWTTLKSKFNF